MFYKINQLYITYTTSSMQVLRVTYSIELLDKIRAIRRGVGDNIISRMP